MFSKKSMDGIKMIDLFFGFDLRQVHIPGFYVAGHYSRRGFEIEPHELAGEHEGKWALTLTRLSEFTDEQAFHGGPIFDSEQDALRYGVKWVTSRGGGGPEGGAEARAARMTCLAGSVINSGER